MLHQWLKSRRLHYVLGVTAILWLLWAGLRLVFLFGFSDLNLSRLEHGAFWQTLGIGLRFDLRLAVLLTLPVALLCCLPWWNPVQRPSARWLARAWLAIGVAVIGLVYILDFGHYNYLGIRLNASALRFAGDADISTSMVWQSYPVIAIGLAWLGGTALTLACLLRLERHTLLRPATAISRWSLLPAIPLLLVLVFLALLGRVSHINIANPVPLRWSDAFFSGDRSLAALGLNPVIFFYETLSIPQRPHDIERVREYYPAMVTELGIDTPNADTLNFRRTAAARQPLITGTRQPNVIFIMLESLGASRVGAYGNPLPTTPNLDAMAAEGWLFRHYYVPVSGTAKTVWASITGIPDVSREESATRNPLITRQHTLINALTGYRKLYMIGGSAGWANMKALIQESIQGVTLYEEGHWRSPNTDVWGISDLNLFKESDAILRTLPDDRPFFAYIQTAGNHRPFTIPRDNDDFQPLELPLAEVEAYGFRSLAQFNAVRLLDYNIGRFLQMARDGGYFDNTIFVVFGDHNNRITTLPHMPPAFERLNLESTHVPHIIYAPGLLPPRVIDDAVSLVDTLPTVLGLLGLPYENTTLGRDIRHSLAEDTGDERVVPLVLVEGSFPVIGAVSRNFLVQMGHDGSRPSLHDLHSATPEQDVAALHPAVFDRFSRLARAYYESARYLMYHNPPRP